MTVSLIDPGGRRPHRPSRRRRIDTGEAATSTSADTDTTPSDDAVARAPAAVTAKPRIFSRAQWGADERMRDKRSLHYGEVHGRVRAPHRERQRLQPAQVPAIIRGIYAYHTQSRGWSDVGYNFLVDRFGRIWEGRSGGVGRPVVGAHTLGYNDDSFAMSAIGNFETARPSPAMLRAFGRLFAWKLGLHGVRPARPGSLDHQAIPPRHQRAPRRGPDRLPGPVPLRQDLGTIRSLAAATSGPSPRRGRRTNLAGPARAGHRGAQPQRTKAGYVLRTRRCRQGRVAVTRTGHVFRNANRLIERR